MMNVDYEFLKQVVLIIIPVSAGIITSKWLTNSWQIKKEKTELKRKILSELDESYGKCYSLLANFTNFIHRNYEDWTTKIDIDGKINPPRLIFPVNSDNMPNKKFNAEIKEFMKNYDKILDSGNNLGTSIALHFSKDLLLDLSKLGESYELIFIMMIKFVNTTDEAAFTLYHDLIKESLEKTRKSYQEFAFRIIKTDMII